VIETAHWRLASGIELHARLCGPAGAPLLVFLHGFPEAAFVWDDLLRHFGHRYRCVAPCLRGFAPTSAPADPARYRARELLEDLDGLLDALGARPVEAVIAHDWGGGIAWAAAARHPEWMRRLVIVNSPHPGVFLRELQHNPRQQEASAYMNFLCRPDAEALLAQDDYARLWPFFTRMGAADPAAPGGNWLTPERRAQYREVWSAGLTGGCNYYRASPLRPPTPEDRSVLELVLPADRLTVRVPTLVVWGELDIALPPSLLDGLEAYVPDLQIVRVPDASHWIVHEQPTLLAEEIEQHLARTP
jgi:pimeloyl-ACP methyl ester carboxylesterase